MKLIDIVYYVALGLLLGLAFHLLFREKPVKTEPTWAEVGYQLYRQPAPGGWIYQDRQSGSITFVPEVAK